MLTIFCWLEKAVGVNPYACIRFASQPRSRIRSLQASRWGDHYSYFLLAKVVRLKDSERCQ